MLPDFWPRNEHTKIRAGLRPAPRMRCTVPSRYGARIARTTARIPREECGSRTQALKILFPISSKKLIRLATSLSKNSPMPALTPSPSANFVAGVIAPVGPLWQS